MAKIINVFDKNSVLDQLVPTYDKNREFGSSNLPAVVGLEVKNKDKADKSSLEIIGGSAFRMSAIINYDVMGGQIVQLIVFAGMMKQLSVQFNDIRKGAYQDTFEEMIKGSFAGLEYIDVLHVNIPKIMQAQRVSDLPDRYLLTPFRGFKINPASDNDLQFIINKYMMCVQFFNNYKATLVEHALIVYSYLHNRDQALANWEVFRGTDPRKAVNFTQNVISSLPLNVAVNDQLTPIRSQIEADKAFVPGYIRTDVNFAIDNASVLHIYISVNYPYLEEKDVDDVVMQILRSRRPSKDEIKLNPQNLGPLPNPNQKDRINATHFSIYWKQKLEYKNQIAREIYMKNNGLAKL